MHISSAAVNSLPVLIRHVRVLPTPNKSQEKWIFGAYGVRDKLKLKKILGLS
jgi:hypothetical protein